MSKLNQSERHQEAIDAESNDKGDDQRTTNQGNMPPPIESGFFGIEQGTDDPTEPQKQPTLTSEIKNITALISRDIDKRKRKIRMALLLTESALEMSKYDSTYIRDTQIDLSRVQQLIRQPLPTIQRLEAGTPLNFKTFALDTQESPHGEDKPPPIESGFFDIDKSIAKRPKAPEATNHAPEIATIIALIRRDIGNIRHEINNALLRAGWALDMVQHRSKYEGEAQKALDRLRGLIQQPIPTIEMLEKGILLHLKNFELIDMINKITAQFPHVECIINQKTYNTLIEADQEMIQTLLQNLIGNAIKFSPDSKEPIVITIDEEPYNIIIEIKDSGMGFDEEDPAKLFERHYRGTRTTHIQGTGIGLDICAQTCKAHGGTITANNNHPDKGATFTVTLPYRQTGPTYK